MSLSKPQKRKSQLQKVRLSVCLRRCCCCVVSVKRGSKCVCACLAGIEVYGNTVSDEAITKDEFVYEPIVPPPSQSKRKETQKREAQIRNCSITVVAAGN